MLFVFSTSFALMALVPAVLIEVNTQRRECEKLSRQERRCRQRLSQEAQTLRHLFVLADSGNTGQVTVADMEALLSNHDVVRELRQAGLAEEHVVYDLRLALFDLREQFCESDYSETEYLERILRARNDFEQALWRSTTATRMRLQDFLAQQASEGSLYREVAAAVLHELEAVQGGLERIRQQAGAAASGAVSATLRQDIAAAESSVARLTRASAIVAASAMPHPPVFGPPGAASDPQGLGHSYGVTNASKEASLASPAAGELGAPAPVVLGAAMLAPPMQGTTWPWRGSRAGKAEWMPRHQLPAPILLPVATPTAHRSLSVPPPRGSPRSPLPLGGMPEAMPLMGVRGRSAPRRNADEGAGQQGPQTPASAPG